MNKLRMAALGLVMTSLAACGSTTSDRALSGAGIGAATGAVGGALLGDSGTAVKGAIIGGAVGAAAGAATKKKDVDLGKPIWR